MLRIIIITIFLIKFISCNDDIINVIESMRNSCDVKINMKQRYFYNDFNYDYFEIENKYFKNYIKSHLELKIKNKNILNKVLNFITNFNDFNNYIKDNIFYNDFEYIKDGTIVNIGTDTFVVNKHDKTTPPNYYATPWKTADEIIIPDPNNQLHTIRYDLGDLMIRKTNNQYSNKILTYKDENILIYIKNKNNIIKFIYVYLINYIGIIVSENFKPTNSFFNNIKSLSCNYNKDLIWKVANEIYFKMNKPIPYNEGYITNYNIKEINKNITKLETINNKIRNDIYGIPQKDDTYNSFYLFLVFGIILLLILAIIFYISCKFRKIRNNEYQKL